MGVPLLPTVRMNGIEFLRVLAVDVTGGVKNL
jgi:hypothetical protein